MSVRASPRLRPWRFVLPTARVSSSTICFATLQACSHAGLDANGFKEAFIKAQQENEALFGKSEQ